MTLEKQAEAKKLQDEQTAKYLNEMGNVFKHYREVKKLCEKQQDCSIGVPVDRMQLFIINDCCTEKEQLAQEAIVEMDKIKNTPGIVIKHQGNEVDCTDLDELLRDFFKKVIGDSKQNSEGAYLKEIVGIESYFSKINKNINNIGNPNNQDLVIDAAERADHNASYIREKLSKINPPLQYMKVNHSLFIYCDEVGAATEKVYAFFDNMEGQGNPKVVFDTFKTDIEAAGKKLQANNFQTVNPEIFDYIQKVSYTVQELERSCNSPDLMPISEL